MENGNKIKTIDFEKNLLVHSTLKLLAIDTSSSMCTVAVQNGTHIQSIHEDAPMQQAKLILPMIEKLLVSCSLSLAELDAICFGCGPGSFTGIRIASSTAQALAFAHQKPLIPVSSLAALAQTIFLKHHHDKILVAVDARMNQLYWGIYQVLEETAQLIGQELLCPPAEILIPTDFPACGAGDGWEKYRQGLAETLGAAFPACIYPMTSVTAEAVLSLAVPIFLKGGGMKAKEAIPVYLR